MIKKIFVLKRFQWLRLLTFLALFSTFCGLLSTFFTNPRIVDNNQTNVMISSNYDLNFDYLADFVVQERYTMGMFIGASVGYLLVNVGSQYIGGITGGINLGVRATLNNRHQFEIGLRGVGIQYRATNEQNVFGFNVFVGVNYSLLLGVK